MGLKTAINLLRNPEKVVGVIKKVKDVITKVKPTLGSEKTKKYLADTAYSRAASTSYAKEMKKPEHLTKEVGKKKQ